MKIVRLEAENVKRLRAVEITPSPDGGLVVIRGNNGQGKSSVLDAIAMAIGGKKLEPPRVIRDGEDSARAMVETEDLVIERRWTAGGSRLEVRSRDGAVHKAPQAKLDALVGRLSFDPLHFLREAPKAQADALRRLVGLDFAELDAKRAGLYQQRTEANRLLADLEAKARGLPTSAPPPVNVAELLAELEGFQRQQEQQAELDRQRKSAWAYLEVQGTIIDKMRAELEQLEARAAKMRAEIEAATAKAEQHRAEAQKLEDQHAALPIIGPDLARVRERLKNAESHNEQAKLAQQRAELDARAAKGRTYVAELTKQIDAVDASKAEQLAAAKMPVPGLAFTPDGVTLNGVPLEQASSAEQLRVSVAMGLALNPKLKVLLVRDGSLLDENSLRMIGEMASSADAQVWIEIVGKGGDGIIIEDGEVER